MTTVKCSLLSIVTSITAALVVLICFSSCVNTRNATYFNDLKDSRIATNQPIPELLLQKNDILSITVTSLNPEASIIFNMPPATVSGTEIASTNGYLINSDGNIEFPILGNVKAAGITKEQLKNNITKSLIDRKLLTDPIVSIRYKNFKVTVLGEVKSPMVLPVPSEKISLLEAIGLAGDLTIYAKRDNVMVIRDEGNARVVKRLNLNSDEIFTSPYYYLKSNDIVYVEPNKARVASATRSQQLLPIVFSALSVVVIIVDRATR
ncbi:MAG: polysaccharide export protein [Chitinophagaceae bacterium]|nr:MAG: polysaccharide export protein [Chitinophagaceae bacterium]